jgi:hypothetical protein
MCFVLAAAAGKKTLLQKVFTPRSKSVKATSKSHYKGISLHESRFNQF